MIRQYTNFQYNGSNSIDMGVTHCSVDSGLYEELFTARRTLVETQTENRRYFKKIINEPLEFPMALYFDQELTQENIQAHVKWLFPDYYKPLYFENQVDRIFYCMPIDEPIIRHNGAGQGYLVVNMRCFDAYIYARPVTHTFDLSANTVSGMTIVLDNTGDIDVYPVLEITNLVDNQTVKIVNNVTNEETTFTGLSLGEVVTLDNDKEEISTSVPGVYRFSNHNDVFLRIVGLQNQFTVYGQCNLEFTYQCKYKTTF